MQPPPTEPGVDLRAHRQVLISAGGLAVVAALACRAAQEFSGTWQKGPRSLA